MNSISNLARKSLFTNKSRTLLTALAILLTTCLLTSIGILSYSIRQMIIDQVTDQTGRIHAEYQDVTDKQVQILRNHVEVETVSEVIGSDIRANDKRLGSISLGFQYIDHPEIAGFIFAEGRLPKADDEIVLEQWILKKLGIREDIGAPVTLGSDHGLTFRLCGILKDNQYSKNWNASAALVTKNFIYQNTKVKENVHHNAAVFLKGGSDLSGRALRLGRSIGVSNENIKINERYITALAGDISIQIPFILVGLIVIFAAGIVIYNIFYISVAQRVRQFGLISAIGGTKKQLRRIILTEGILLSFAGIPAGLIVGYAVSRFLIPLLAMDGLKVSTTPWVFVLAALVSLLSLIFAMRKPARQASDVSPVEAIRYSGSEMHTKRKLKKSGKVPGVRQIAWLNLWRNRKRTVMTLVSLIMSGVLLLLFSSILGSMNINNLTDMMTTGDFQLTSNNTMRDTGTDPLTKKTVEWIRNTDGVSEVNPILFNFLDMELQQGKVTIIPDAPEAERKNMKECNCTVYGYEDRFLQKELEYVTGDKVSMEHMKQKNAVLILSEDGQCQFKPGDIIRVKKYSSGSKPSEVEFTVAGVVKKNINWMGFSGLGPTLITHRNTFERLQLDQRIARVCVNADKKKYKEVKSRLDSIATHSGEITCVSQKETNEAYERQISGFKLAAAGLVGIIGLIGILNLMNTMITSILSRKKEIGMLQAVGLTGSQLGRLLQLEGLYYSTVSAVASVVAGTGLGYVFFTLFKREATYAEYVFPTGPILFIIVAYLLIQLLITFIIQRNLGRESVIERIRLNE